MKRLICSSISIKTALNKKTMIIYLIIMFIFYSILSIGQTVGKWTLKKDKNGIKVYIRSEPKTGLPEFKGIARIDAPLASLVAVLRDVEEYSHLFAGVSYASLLQYEQDLQICYMKNECPFPFSDRDGIYSSTFYHDPIKGKMYISIVGLPDYLPEVPNMVRVTSTRGLWILEPLNDGTVKVLYQQYADPGGSFPNWIIKLYSVTIPYKALSRLRSQVKWAKYQFDTIGDKPALKNDATSYIMTPM